MQVLPEMITTQGSAKADEALLQDNTSVNLDTQKHPRIHHTEPH
jgi:hypothetical protein